MHTGATAIELCSYITNIILAAYEANILSIKTAIASPVGHQNDLENYDELGLVCYKKKSKFPKIEVLITQKNFDFCLSMATSKNRSGHAMEYRSKKKENRS